MPTVNKQAFNGDLQDDQWLESKQVLYLSELMLWRVFISTEQEKGFSLKMVSIRGQHLLVWVHNSVEILHIQRKKIIQRTQQKRVSSIKEQNSNSLAVSSSMTTSLFSSNFFSSLCHLNQNMGQCYLLSCTNAKVSCGIASLVWYQSISILLNGWHQFESKVY